MTSFWEHGAEGEIKHGKNMADAAKSMVCAEQKEMLYLFSQSHISFLPLAFPRMFPHLSIALCPMYTNSVKASFRYEPNINL